MRGRDSDKYFEAKPGGPSMRQKRPASEGGPYMDSESG